MIRPLPVALALLAGAGAIGLPAHAGAPVQNDTGRVASAQLSLSLADGGSVRLDLRAADLSSGPRLTVYAERCDDSGACTNTVYTSPLAAGSLTVDPSVAQADLHTTVAGRALHIHWVPSTNPAAVAEGTEYSGDESGDSVTTYAGGGADTSVSFDGARCGGFGGVGTGSATFLDTPLDPRDDRPVSALRLPSAGSLTCG